MKKKGIWITLVIVLIIVLWAFGAYNGMVNKQEAATTALADVQSTYQRRADLLPNLTRVVKAYAKHENSTFKEVAEARSKASQISLDASSLTPEKLKQFDAAQGELSAALGKLMMVSERYPDLKASENFKDLQIQLEGTENRINVARKDFNDSTKAYNASIRKFPKNILAGIFGFSKRAYFEAAEGAENAPKVEF